MYTAFSLQYLYLLLALARYLSRVPSRGGQLLLHSARFQGYACNVLNVPRPRHAHRSAPHRPAPKFASVVPTAMRCTRSGTADTGTGGSGSAGPKGGQERAVLAGFQMYPKYLGTFRTVD
jgi:hypothetical protein